MKKIFISIIFLISTSQVFASIYLNVDCAKLVNHLGGLNKVDILWLDDHNDKKYQYALINISKKNVDKEFYLCGNKFNIKKTTDKTLHVLSERNLLLRSFDPIQIFTKIFSVTSKESRKYIMQRLNLKDFSIDRNQLNQARVAGLMELNNKLNHIEKKVVKKEIKKTENINNAKDKKF